jgi:ubiquinone/menaquinone biosynthesis C-methylase UbiE
VTAAKVVGSKGPVFAVDISSQMLAIARQISAYLKLQGIIEFKESDVNLYSCPLYHLMQYFVDGD